MIPENCLMRSISSSLVHSRGFTVLPRGAWKASMPGGGAAETNQGKQQGSNRDAADVTAPNQLDPRAAAFRPRFRQSTGTHEQARAHEGEKGQSDGYGTKQRQTAAPAGARVPVQVRAASAQTTADRSKRFGGHQDPGKSSSVSAPASDSSAAAVDDTGRSKGNSQRVVGTCEDMCPVRERQRRENACELDRLERPPDGSYRTDKDLCVKQWVRNQPDDLPSEDVRTERALKKTQNHLWTLLDRVDVSLSSVYPFLSDRLRSVRQDITLQGLESEFTVRAFEETVRFYILSAYELGTCGCEDSTAHESEAFVSHLNIEQLNKTLQTLLEQYHDFADKGTHFRTEPEFQAYMFILSMAEHGKYKPNAMEVKMMPRTLRSDVLHSKEMQFAFQCNSAFTAGNYSRFFKLIQSAPYIFACLLSIYLPNARLGFLKQMQASFPSSRKSEAMVPLKTVVQRLRLQGADHARQLLQHYQQSINTDDSSHELCWSSTDEQVVRPTQEFNDHSSPAIDASRPHTRREAVTTAPAMDVSLGSARSRMPVQQKPHEEMQMAKTAHVGLPANAIAPTDGIEDGSRISSFAKPQFSGVSNATEVSTPIGAPSNDTDTSAAAFMKLGTQAVMQHSDSKVDELHGSPKEQEAVNFPMPKGKEDSELLREQQQKEIGQQGRQISYRSDTANAEADKKPADLSLTQDEVNFGTQRNVHADIFTQSYTSSEDREKGKSISADACFAYQKKNARKAYEEAIQKKEHFGFQKGSSGPERLSSQSSVVQVQVESPSITSKARTEKRKRQDEPDHQKRRKAEVARYRDILRRYEKKLDEDKTKKRVKLWRRRAREHGEARVRESRFMYFLERSSSAPSLESADAPITDGPWYPIHATRQIEASIQPPTNLSMSNTPELLYQRGVRAWKLLLSTGWNGCLEPNANGLRAAEWTRKLFSSAQQWTDWPADDVVDSRMQVTFLKEKGVEISVRDVGALYRSVYYEGSDALVFLRGSAIESKQSEEQRLQALITQATPGAKLPMLVLDARGLCTNGWQENWASIEDEGKLGCVKVLSATPETVEDPRELISALHWLAVEARATPRLEAMNVLEQMHTNLERLLSTLTSGVMEYLKAHECRDALNLCAEVIARRMHRAAGEHNVGWPGPEFSAVPPPNWNTERVVYAQSLLDRLILPAQHGDENVPESLTMGLESVLGGHERSRYLVATRTNWISLYRHAMFVQLASLRKQVSEQDGTVYVLTDDIYAMLKDIDAKAKELNASKQRRTRKRRAAHRSSYVHEDDVDERTELLHSNKKQQQKQRKKQQSYMEKPQRATNKDTEGLDIGKRIQSAFAGIYGMLREEHHENNRLWSDILQVGTDLERKK